MITLKSLIVITTGLLVLAPVARAAESAPSMSLVYVAATSQRHRFTTPWEKSPPARKRGLGVVIGKNRVIVTAEITADATFIEFERPSNGKKATAKVVARDYECNLALLETADPASDFLADMTPLELDTPAKAGDPLDVWQLEDDGSPVITRGTLARVETGAYYLPDRTFLRYAFKGSLQNKAGSFIIPAVRNHKLTGLLLGYNANEQMADILPAPTIRRFLDDLADGEFTGFPTLGVRISRTTDEQLRGWLGLPDTVGGVFLSKIETGSSADLAGLKESDVLLSLDGFAIDRRGYYDDPEFGALNFSHIVTGRKKTGESVTAKVWRDKAEVTLPVKLTRREASDYLVDPWIYDRGPRYLVLGGLVFTELSRPYLQSFKDWEKNAPTTLRYAEANQDEFADGRKKLVILCYAIPTPVNVGYEKLASRVIKEVNGKAIGSIRDLHEALMKPIDGRHAITTTDDDPVIYLDAAMTEVVDKQLQANGVDPLTRLE